MPGGLPHRALVSASLFAYLVQKGSGGPGFRPAPIICLGRSSAAMALFCNQDACSMDVVIVESPAKAKTINGYLGKNFEVYASFGHVRDLPAKDGSVDPDADFAMLWEVDAKASKRLSDIAAAVRREIGRAHV